MGGKSYFCDYCCCFMKNDLNVRKLHNAGVSHSAAKATYLRRFEDPHKTLVAERMKKPCKRFLAGYCKFQLLCNFSHYSEKQLMQLAKIVSQGKKCSKRSKTSVTKQRNLPPSLQPLNLEKIQYTNWELRWG